MVYTQVGSHKPLNPDGNHFRTSRLRDTLDWIQSWKWMKMKHMHDKIIYHLSRTTILNHCGHSFQRMFDETCIWSHNSYPKPFPFLSPIKSQPQAAFGMPFLRRHRFFGFFLPWQRCVFSNGLITPKMEVTNPRKPWWKPFQNIQAEGHPWLASNWKWHQGGNICQTNTFFIIVHPFSGWLLCLHVQEWWINGGM